MIKRWVAVWMLFCVLWCGGCASDGYAPPQTEQLQSRLSGYYAQMQLQATLHRTGHGTLTLLMESPSTLQGMRFTCQADGTVLLQYRDLQFPAQQLPQGSLASVLCAVLDDVARRAEEVSGGTAVGKTDSGQYSLRYAPNGMPLQLTVPALSIDLQFTDI